MKRLASHPTERAELQGYAHGSYAASLATFGTPRHLPRSGGWILEREIPGTDMRDAMGCYPLFTSQDWRGLEADLDDIDGMVSLCLVSDPFGDYDEKTLRRSFRDLVVPFKAHFVTELSRPVDGIVSRHHRYYARKALASVSVERCDRPEEHLDTWIALYDELIARHQLTGIHAFSRAAFAMQLRVPGLVMLRAIAEGSTVGAHLWYVQGDVAYSHLAAASARGYELMASYALYWCALETFARDVAWLSLGAGPGLAAPAGGLATFKRGWSTGTRMAYLCGRIVDRDAYDALVAAREGSPSPFFPAYRHGV